MPYCNLHDLNIDWILNIIKDFNAKYSNLEETFDGMVESINAAHAQALADIESGKTDALSAMQTYLDTCYNELDRYTTAFVTQLQNVTNEEISALNTVGQQQYDNVTQAGTTAINALNTIVQSIPADYNDALNQMQMIVSLLNQSTNYPMLIQGYYASGTPSIPDPPAKTLVNDNTIVSTLLTSGAQNLTVDVEVTQGNAIISSISYWTMSNNTETFHPEPVNSSSVHFTFPANTTDFFISFVSSTSTATPISPSDFTATIAWTCAFFTFDNFPIKNSINPVTGGGIYDAFYKDVDGVNASRLCPNGITSTGITIEPIDSTHVKITGQATATRYWQMVNVNTITNIASGTAGTNVLPAGTYKLEMYFTGVFSGANRTVRVASSGGISNGIAVVNGDTFTISETSAVAFTIPSGYNFGDGTEDNYTILTMRIYVDNDAEDKVTRKLLSTNDATDRTRDVYLRLLNYGECVLGAGTFYIHNLIMPEHTKITGSGDSTIVVLDSSLEDSYCIRMNSYCIISNIGFDGGDNTVYSSRTGDVGTRHAIEWFGNYSGSGNFVPRNGLINNVFIRGFSGSGIYMYDTGPDSDASVIISDSFIENCEAGICCEYRSEYNTISNVKCRTCYYGIILNGGNNIVSACHFTKNVIGMLIDDRGGESANSAHCTITACTFNHIGVTSTSGGNAIRVLGTHSGLVFSDCQFFYSSIYLYDTKRISFTNCNFKFNASYGITILSCRLIMFTNCVADASPMFFIDSGSNPYLKVDNCYTPNANAWSTF